MTTSEAIVGIVLLAAPDYWVNEAWVEKDVWMRFSSTHYSIRMDSKGYMLIKSYGTYGLAQGPYGIAKPIGSNGMYEMHWYHPNGERGGWSSLMHKYGDVIREKWIVDTAIKWRDGRYVRTKIADEFRKIMATP